jgi:hypothetical protein
MNRPPFVRLSVTALGGAVAVAAFLTFLIVSSEGSGVAPSGWAVLLIAGGSVGLLSWFLFAGIGRGESRGAGPQVVRCESCGAEVREDWRLCPFCGDSSEPRIGQNAIRGQREVEV